MKKIVLCFMLSVAMTGVVPCRAGQDQSFMKSLEEAGREAGKDFKKAGREMQGTGKEISREMGKTGKEISRFVKRNTKEADQKAEKGFSRALKQIGDDASKSWNDFRRFMGWD